jgi:ATP-dependent Lon protease
MAISIKDKKKTKKTIVKKFPKEALLPMVPLRDVVIFPFLEIVLSFGREKSIKAVERAFAGNKLIFFTAQKNAAISDPIDSDLYEVGTVCRIERLLRTGNEINALVKGIKRAKILKADLDGKFAVAKVSLIKETNKNINKSQALTKILAANLKKLVNMGKPVDFLVFMKLMSGVSMAEMVDQVAAVLEAPSMQKQKILEIIDIYDRLIQVSSLIGKEVKILEIEHSIASKTQKKFDKSMREAVLRERMKTIQKELKGNETEDADPDIAEFRKKVKKMKLPKEVKEKINKEINRLARMPNFNPEAGYIRNYLEWITDLPWGVKSENEISNKKAEEILDRDHYGLKKVKERILEYLSVMSLKRKQGKKLPQDKIRNTTILCFVGPPGVGKTSIGRSIATALGRKFVKVSVGGIRDEAEIRGHRRTYVGARPGRIIQGIKDAKTCNPVFMLDEIDKIGSDFRGDPSSALLEALDSEQNFGFSDHYLEIPYDLSDVLFITTANVLDTIPPALRDRLEIIRFSGYTVDEKFNIGKKYLVKKTMYGSGLLNKQVNVTDSALTKMISGYTKEAGVRELERQLNKIMRKIAKKIEDKELKKGNVSNNNLKKYLGPKKYLETMAEKYDDVGICTGLAWTQVGGDVLFVEVALMPGKGKVQITGQLGDVMKESCKAAVSFIRSHHEQLKLPKGFNSYKHDFHIHVPEGAVPKDGPSAGVTIATAIYSAISGKKVKKDIAMTGEITLRGRVLPIGGLKEKLIAAHRAGIKTVMIPAENEKDLEEVPNKVKKGLDIKFAKEVEDVFKVAIVK